MNDQILKSWDENNHRLWGFQPLGLDHRLHELPLFSRDSLAQLIESYPRERYNLIATGGHGADRCWQEGDLAGLNGDEVLRSIELGRFWLNLRETDLVDPRYSELLEAMYGEIGEHLGGSRRFPDKSLGLLISSPGAEVYYHCDLPNQSLWQIMGRKTVYLYPPAEPFMKGEDLEKIAVFEKEVDIEYQRWFDDYAMRYELAPGQMLNWRLNAPHRVVNHDCLNVSVTTEYWSNEANRRRRVNLMNGLMRYGLGLKPRSRAVEGLGYQCKAALSTALSRTGLLDRWLRSKRAGEKPVEFGLNKFGPDFKSAFSAELADQ